MFILFLFVLGVIYLSVDLVGLVLYFFTQDFTLYSVIEQIGSSLFGIVTLLFLWYLAGVMDTVNDTIQKFVIGLIRRSKGKTLSDIAQQTQEQ